jgi:hypothetical protein
MLIAPWALGGWRHLSPSDTSFFKRRSKSTEGAPLLALFEKGEPRDTASSDPFKLPGNKLGADGNWPHDPKVFLITLREFVTTTAFIT